MQRKFLKSLILLLVLNLMVKPFWILGIDRAVQNTVGASEYGFYFAIFNFSFLFNILLDFGITNFNNKNIAQNNHLLRKHLSRIMVLKIMLFVVYLMVTFTGAFIIKYNQEQIRLLILLACNQFLVSFILYLRSNLGGLHLFKTDSMVSVLDRLLMIIICGVLLWGQVVNEFKIQYFVYAQTLAYLITVSVTFSIVLHKAGAKFFRLSWNLPFLIIIVRQSLPFALLVLLMTFYNRIDSVMLERMLENGAKFSGIYASAYRLLDASNMIAYLFAVLLLPIFSRMIKFRQPVEQLVKLSYTLIIIPAILVVVVAFFYSTEIMQMLYPIHQGESVAAFQFRIEESSRVFGLLMACFAAISTTYVFGTLLTANGNLTYLNLVSLTAMALNISLNLLLIPRMQATGSAIASLITQFLIALIQVFIVRKIFAFQTNMNFLLRLGVYIAVVVMLGWGTSMLPFDWKLSLLIMGAASLGAALSVGLLRIGNIWQLLKYEDN